MKKKIREIKTDAGDFKYVSVIPVYSVPVAGSKRKVKFKPTSDAVEKINERNRQLYFEQLIHANADDLTLTLTLTYDDDFLPDGVEQIRKDIQNWIRRAGRLYKKNNAELKYIYVSQYGEERGRPHHHVLISGGVDEKELLKSWDMGIYSEVKKIEYNEKGAAGLAHYISRDMSADLDKPIIWRKRWSCSRNLKKNDISSRDGVFSQKDVKFIADNFAERDILSVSARDRLEKRYAGYTLCGVDLHVSGYNGDKYIYLKFYKSDTPLLSEWRGQILKAKSKNKNRKTKERKNHAV